MSNKLLRARKTKDPCPQCFLHRERCLCHLIPRLDLRTRLTLVIHSKELKRTTNTGRLALLALNNSTMRVRGEGTEGLDLSDILVPGYQSVLLYPSEGSLVLNREFAKGFQQPLNLIVPDGNWRQAGKVGIRHPELLSLPRVRLEVASREHDRHLRAESSPFGMATLEAIAYAMEVLEGESAGRALLALYGEKLSRTLAGRPPT